MKICILIPCYRHGKALGAVLERLRAFSLPVIVIDDGCTGEDREALLKAVAAFTGSAPSVPMRTIRARARRLSPVSEKLSALALPTRCRWMRTGSMI